MAARKGIQSWSGVSTGSASPKTVAQLVGPSLFGLRLHEFGIGFHGVNNAHEPILVELIKQTTAGTMSAGTLVKHDASISDALQTSAQEDASAEPTAGDVLRRFTVHPQTGLVVSFVELGELILPPGSRLGVRVTAANATTCDGHLVFEE